MSTNGTNLDLSLNSVQNRLNNFTYNQRISFSKKKSNDFAWAEEMADYYDYYYGIYTNSEKIKKYKMNYNLFNGRGDEAMAGYLDDLHSVEIEQLGITAGFENVQHHDIISQIAKAMVGEQRQRPLTATAIDTSGYALNQRKRQKLELLQQYIDQQVMGPIRQQVSSQYMQEMGIMDPYSLSQEDQKQMQADIQQRSQAKTPPEIFEYMKKDYKSPSEVQAQKLLDFLTKELKIKWVTDEGFKHAVITGEEIYHIGVRHNEPFLDLVNPMGFTYSASPNTFFIEDGEWAKYEQIIKYSELFNKYGDQFRARDYKRLDNLFHGISDNGYSGVLQSNLVAKFSNLPEGVTDNINSRTNEGQEWLKDFYNENGSLHQAQADIREVHIVWKSLRKLKYITRIEKGARASYWMDESYVYSELKGDLEEKIVWVPEVWETTKIGTIDALYFNKRPIPFQYKSVHNPWDVKLPYYGVQYGRLMGNTKNVSPVDLGKPWQYKFNVQMARLHEMEATDIGKVLLTTMGAKPKDWDWKTFFMMLKYGKIAPLDLSQDGVSAYDAQFFKSIDLSNMDKIAGQLQYLQWLQQQVATAMSYNPSRLGQVSPYTPVSNNQQNIVQSSFQTEDLYSTHAQVVENLLNGLIDTARVAYKDNPVKRTYLLDDMSIAELELDWEMLARSELGIKISNSAVDFQNLQQVKQQAQSMIQNGLISFPELIKLTWANSGAEVLNMAEEAERKNEQRQQEEYKKQQELVQQQKQMQQELASQAAEIDRIKQDKELAYKYAAAELDAMKMANQYDINKDGINDGLQRQQMVNRHQATENEKDRNLEREKLNIEDVQKNKDRLVEKEKVKVARIQKAKSSNK